MPYGDSTFSTNRIDPDAGRFSYAGGGLDALARVTAESMRDIQRNFQRLSQMLWNGDIATNKGGVFVVALTQTGGATGTQSAAATWTYTATSLAGVVLGTVLSPERPRSFGTRTAATKGYAYYNNAGTFTLAEAWETPGSGGC